MDITRIFKSKVRRLLFRLYFTTPEEAFYLRQLERKLETPVSIIRKELRSLEKQGLFQSFKHGNLLYYKVNKDYPLFKEFKSIVQKTIGVQGLLKEHLSSLKNIKTAFIYGSFARNKQIISSDIDLFLIGKIDENQVLEKITHLEKQLDREINYTLYSPEEFKNKKKQNEPFIMNLIKNEKIFLVGYEDDL